VPPGPRGSHRCSQPAGLFDFVRWGWNQGYSLGKAPPVPPQPWYGACPGHTRHHTRSCAHLPQPQEPAPGEGSFHLTTLFLPSSCSSPRPGTSRSGPCLLAAQPWAQNKAPGRGVRRTELPRRGLGPSNKPPLSAPVPGRPWPSGQVGGRPALPSPLPLNVGDSGHRAASASGSLGPNEK